MIASVSGEVIVRRPDHVVLSAAGVGYRLDVSTETLKAVPAIGNETTLHAQLITRDDSMRLYGFASEAERDLFCELNTVSGIGPKVALATLSGGSPRELITAIASGDEKRFQAVPGIGKRTAQRIVMELRDRVVEAIGDAPGPGSEGEEDAVALAREGLVGLGYSLVEATRLLEGAEGDRVEDLISGALRRGAGEPAR